ncbi:MAG: rhomboid family intramembrane serine protease [Alphaproteobacteria bacterium]|nr:rhomboid family intramembrane serine protease [Alphaproteobacteria bacterium]
MKKKSNGHDQKADKVVRFPDISERQRREEERLRAQYKAERQAEKEARAKNAGEPFFNFGRVPVFTRFLVASLIVVHLVVFFGFSASARYGLVETYGFVPAHFTRGFDWSFATLISPLSHVFLHGGWLHLFFNVVTGLVFCLFFERVYGVRAAALFFVFCALGGAGLYFALAPFSDVPVIGASGGLSGFFGAMLLMMAQRLQAQSSYYSSAAYYNGQAAAQIKMRRMMGRYGPWPLVVVWGVLLVVLGMASSLLGAGDVAWSAHLGGYITGVALTFLMQKGKIRL